MRSSWKLLDRARFILLWSDCHCRFNGKAFGNQLPQDLKITWNVHLKTTAGLTYYERKLVDSSDEPRSEITVKASMCCNGKALCGLVIQKRQQA